MILVTGGSGFIGGHTVRALHDLGESCVIVSRSSSQVPEHLADLPVVSEQADVADLDSLRAIGARHPITGIVHLAGYPAPRGSVGGVDATHGLLDGLLNIVRVAQDWGVRAHRTGEHYRCLRRADSRGSAHRGPAGPPQRTTPDPPVEEDR